MIELSEIADILFDGFYCGGYNGNSKIRVGKSKPVSLEYASKRYPYLLGKLKTTVILVDYDTDETFYVRLELAKKLNQHCIAIKGAHKGGHIYFFNVNQSYKSSNNKNTTVLSFYPVDYKCGIKLVKSTGEIKASDSYGALSKDDKTLREILYCNIKKDGTLDEIPFYDLPLKGLNTSALNMADGEGRNEFMHNYMIPLKTNGYTYEQYRECANIINEFLFAEPFDSNEFETVTRPEEWDSLDSSESSIFFKGSSFLHDKFAEHIKDVYHIKIINNQLHVYKDGIYISSEKEIKKCIVKELPSLTDMKVNEVLKRLNIICDDVTIDDTNAHLIAFMNGVYNILSDEFKPFSSDTIITNRIPWNYNKDAQSSLADETLNKISCNDIQIRSLLEECIGSCFYRSNTLAGGKAFILTGTGSNGKSTFIELIQSIIGQKNYSVLDLKSLSDRFSTVMLFGKLANLGDDISNEYISDVSTFKKITRGNEIDAEQKGQPKFSFKPYCKLIFSANDIPRTKDNTGAAQDRLLIIPFNAHFSKDDADYDNTIGWKLQSQEVIEYLIQLGIQGLKRVLLNRQYTHSSKVDEQLQEYRISNNPVLSFIDEVGVDAIENEPTKDVFLRYSTYCAENGFKGLSNNPFSKQICNLLKMETKPKKIQGKNYRVFIKK